MTQLLDLDPEERDAALELFQQELQNQGNQMQMVAETKVASTNMRANAQAMDYAVKSSTTLGNKSPAYNDAVDWASGVYKPAAYESTQRYKDAMAWASQAPQEHTPGTPMITMDSIYSNVVGQVAQGDRVIKTFGGAQVRTTPSGKTVVTTAPAPSTIKGDTTSGTIVSGIPPQDNQKVALRLYEQTSGPQNVTNLGFDVEKAVRELNNLNGDARNIASMQLLSNMDTAQATRSAMLRKQADIESGIAEADTAVKRLSQAALARGWEPSSTIEVVNAIAVQQQAIAASHNRATNLIAQDAEITKLTASKDIVRTLINRSFAQGDRDQALVETVTDEELLNHTLLIPSTGDAFKDRLMVAKMKATDKDYKALVGFNSDTAPSLLMSENPIIRAKALRLQVARDKTINPYNPVTGSGIDPNATETQVSSQIAAIMGKNTEALMIEYYGKSKEAEEALGQYRRTTGDERKRADANIKAALLPAILEKEYAKSYQDAAKWVGTNVRSDQPLGKIINAFKSTSKDGTANMNHVIEAFITDETINGPDGKPLPFEQRINMLHTTIGDTATAELKSVLIVRPQAIQARLKEQIKNTAYRAKIAYTNKDLATQTNRIGTSPFENVFTSR